MRAGQAVAVLLRPPVARFAALQAWDALRSGAIEVEGSPALARALPTWNRHGWAADDPRAGYDGSTRHQPAPALAATPT